MNVLPCYSSINRYNVQVFSCVLCKFIEFFVYLPLFSRNNTLFHPVFLAHFQLSQFFFLNPLYFFQK